MSSTSSSDGLIDRGSPCPSAKPFIADSLSAGSASAQRRLRSTGKCNRWDGGAEPIYHCNHGLSTQGGVPTILTLRSREYEIRRAILGPYTKQVVMHRLMPKRNGGRFSKAGCNIVVINKGGDYEVGVASAEKSVSDKTCIGGEARKLYEDQGISDSTMKIKKH